MTTTTTTYVRTYTTHPTTGLIYDGSGRDWAWLANRDEVGYRLDSGDGTWHGAGNPDSREVREYLSQEDIDRLPSIAICDGCGRATADCACE